MKGERVQYLDARICYGIKQSGGQVRCSLRSLIVTYALMMLQINWCKNQCRSVNDWNVAAMS